MAQGIFIAEVVSDSTAYGKDAKSRLKSIGSLISGGGTVPIGTVEWQAAGDPTYLLSEDLRLHYYLGVHQYLSRENISW